MNDISSEINLARIVASQNKLNESIKILKGVIRIDPDNEDAWLALSEVVEDPDHVKQCLERVLRLDPRNPIARQRLDKLTGPDPEIPLFLQGMTDSNNRQGQPQHRDNQPEDEIYQDSPREDFSLLLATSENLQIPAAPRFPQTEKLPRVKSTGRTLELTLMGLAVVIIVVIAVVSLLPPRGALLAAHPTPIIEDPIAVIRENMRAANAEDLEAYMATIYPRALVLMSTESTLKDLNETYDLQYQVSNLSILEQDKREARVSFVLTTRKIHGPDFKNNRLTGVFILRMYEGHWMIYDQEIEKVDYID